MKICIVTSSYPRTPTDPQSSGTFVRHFALELAKKGPKVYIFTHAREGKIKNDPELNVVRFKCRSGEKPLATLNPLNPLDIIKIVSIIRQGRKKLLDLILKEEIDYCLAMWVVPSGYWTFIVKKKLGIPYATWALGSDIWEYPKYPIIRSIIKMVLRSSNKLFADGIVLAQDVERLSKRNCEFLHIRRILLKKDLLKINLGKKQKNFLYVGRYHKHKGIDILIEAINIIPRDVLTNMKFYIFGGGNLEKKIKQQVQKYKLDNTVMINSYASPVVVASYLSACDCLIIPSRIESIPSILSDGLQMGTPVIVTDVGDMGTLVRKYKIGMVVKPENLEELRDAIINFPKEGKEKYRINLKKLNSIFDIKRSVNRFLEVIKEKE